MSQRVGTTKSQRIAKPSTKVRENSANEQILLEQEMANQTHASEQLAQILQYVKEHKEESNKLSEQVKQMATTIADLQKTINGLEKALSESQPSLPRSYASAASSPKMLSPLIAVTPPDSSPNLRSISNPSSTRAAAQGFHRLPSIELNLQDTIIATEEAKELQEIMNEAMQTIQGLENAKCTAVAFKGKERVQFVFDNEQTAQTVKQKEPWKNILELEFDKAKPITQERFKVKLSGVDKFKIGNPGKGEKMPEQLCCQLNEENSLAIQAIRCLSQPSERRTVQLLLVCSTQEEKSALLAKGYISMQGQLAYVGEFHESHTIQCKSVSTAQKRDMILEAVQLPLIA
ncbi:MAG: hypothetical protein M1822_003459 [Bathelium mastoideum]|nr:MAG: hypothetical protein M1822_003459 [Bathelium mastoideum]